MQDKLPKIADEESGIASALIRARNELGITQAQLADQSGISRSAIKGYETGRNMPGSRELKALCRVLRVSPTTLLYGSEQAFRDRANLPAHPGADPINLDLGRARWRLHAITNLLALDEVVALSQLARSIAVARHGVKRVSDVARVGDTFGVLTAGTGAGAKLGDTIAEIGQFVDALDAEAAAHKASQEAGEPGAGE